jgi:hypothetical protein
MLQFHNNRSEGHKGGCYTLKATFKYSGEIEVCDMMSSGPSFNEGSRADASLVLDNDNVDVLAIPNTPVEGQAAQALELELKLRSDQVDVNAGSRTRSGDQGVLAKLFLYGRRDELKRYRHIKITFNNDGQGNGVNTEKLTSMLGHGRELPQISTATVPTSPSRNELRPGKITNPKRNSWHGLPAVSPSKIGTS